MRRLWAELEARVGGWATTADDSITCQSTKGDALAAELRELGATADFIRADVRRDDEVRDLRNMA